MPFSWEVPFLVVVIIASIVYFAGRTKRDRDGRPPAQPLTGDALIEQIQKTLGIGIMVESVERAAPDRPDEPEASDGAGGSTTIRAALMSGRYTTQIAVTADSEAKAWEDLGRAAIAWRNADFQHVPMWWGAGG
jgi:hypothetical protein